MPSEGGGEGILPQRVAGYLLRAAFHLLGEFFLVKCLV